MTTDTVPQNDRDAQIWAKVDDDMAKAPHLKLKLSEDGSLLSVEPSGTCWAGLAKVTNNPWLAAGVIQHLSALGSHGQRADEGATNLALGFVNEMAPEDPAELLLLTQMAAIHQATMMLARRLNHADTIQQQDAAERALNKLARTFATQMDSLKKYRSKGHQTVRVERVTVEPGGQAIVGHVAHGGGNAKT